MRAVQYGSFGGPELLQYVTDAPRPKVGKVRPPSSRVTGGIAKT